MNDLYSRLKAFEGRDRPDRPRMILRKHPDGRIMDNRGREYTQREVDELGTAAVVIETHVVRKEAA